MASRPARTFEGRPPALFLSLVVLALVATPAAVLLFARNDPDSTPLVGGILTVSMLTLAVAIVAGSHRIRLTVDATEVRIAYGSTPFRTRLPHAEIQRVEVVDLTWWSWGGWGYRGSRRLFGKAAIYLRPGPAVQFHLADETSLAVTLADAELVAHAVEQARRGQDLA